MLLTSAEPRREERYTHAFHLRQPAVGEGDKEHPKGGTEPINLCTQLLHCPKGLGRHVLPPLETAALAVELYQVAPPKGRYRTTLYRGHQPRRIEEVFCAEVDKALNRVRVEPEGYRRRTLFHKPPSPLLLAEVMSHRVEEALRR